MVFPANNLPSTAQPWTREVQKRVENIEATAVTNEVNNVARDAQLSNSVKRINTIVNSVFSAGTTEINGFNIKAGTIEASSISAGELVGFTIKTAASGTRVEMAGTDIKFYYGTTMVGKLVGTNYSGSDSMAMLYQDTDYGLYLEPQGGLWYGPHGMISLGTYGPGMQYDWSHAINVLSTGVSITGPMGATGAISGSSLSATNAVSGGSLSSSGTLTVSGQSNFNGTMYAAGMTATSSSGGIPVWRSTSSNQLYAYTSSRKQKTDIQPLDIDYDKFTSMPVHSFIYNADFEEFGQNAQRAYGYIAEELDELEYDNLVVFKNNEETGEKEPYSVSFFSLAAATHYVTNIQAQKIRSLEERLATLEAK
jgi:hypothetical protein